MYIAGLVKSSLIDYPGKVAAVIFTQGCNFRCGFCHNPDLIPLNPCLAGRQVSPHTSHLIPESEVLDFLTQRVGKLDGVVITGGEPTLQPDLLEFIKKIKELGFAVKLDTNGSSPAALKHLITKRLIDYIAMDIKNSPALYEKTIGMKAKKKTERSEAPHFSNGIGARVRKSIDLIRGSGIDYEFRTTVLPALHSMKSIEELSQAIKGANRYVIQNFRNGNVLDDKLKDSPSFTRVELAELKEIAARNIGDVQVRENL